MLIIERKKHQTIKIGKDITIKICDFHKQDGRTDGVYVGIDAPKEVKITRD